MVVSDYYGSDTCAEITVDIGTADTTVIVFAEDAGYIEPIITIKKNDPFWTKQGKNKKGGKGRYVSNH